MLLMRNINEEIVIREKIHDNFKEFEDILEFQKHY